MTLQDVVPSLPPPGSEPEPQETSSRVMRERQEVWREQMLAQQNAFLTLAGLELTALTIYAGMNRAVTPLFFLPVALVAVQVAMTILLMNAERETAWGAPYYLKYRGKGWEKRWRKSLIAIILLVWLSLAALLILGVSVKKLSL